jgi:hypothetical protein
MSAIPEAFSDLLTTKKAYRYPYRNPGEARVTFTIAPDRVQTMG